MLKIKYFSVALLLTVVSTGFCMDTPSEDELTKIPSLPAGHPVITEPYQSGFAAQHPMLLRAAAAVAAGGTTSALAYCKQQNLTKAVCLGAAASVAGLLFEKRRGRRCLLDSLLFDPREALAYAYKINEQMVKEAKRQNLDEEDDIAKCRSLLEKFRRKCPIVLLGECVKEDWGACALSRSYNPKYRETFENKAVSALLESEQNHADNPLQYAGFATGGMFQDFVVLAKALARKPDASISVHLIDLKFTPYAAARDLIGNIRQVNPESNIDITPVFQQLEDIAREKWGAEKTKPEKLKKDLVNDCVGLEESLKQFISYLQGTFPRAQLSLLAHPDTESYLNYLDQNNISYPDVITAVDIQDEMSLLRRSAPHYAQLCVKTLLKNPDSLNIWLAKGGDNMRTAEIRSLSLDSVPGAQEEHIEIDGVETPVYISSETI